MKVKLKLLLFIGVTALMFWVIYSSWQPKRILIDGHDYIEYPEMEGVELIHSPECTKCKEDKI